MLIRARSVVDAWSGWGDVRRKSNSRPKKKVDGSARQVKNEYRILARVGRGEGVMRSHFGKTQGTISVDGYPIDRLILVAVFGSEGLEDFEEVLQIGY